MRLPHPDSIIDGFGDGSPDGNGNAYRDFYLHSNTNSAFIPHPNTNVNRNEHRDTDGNLNTLGICRNSRPEPLDHECARHVIHDCLDNGQCHDRSRQVVAR